MYRTFQSLTRCLLVFPLLAQAASADTFDDSKLVLDFRNFYMNRNFVNDKAPISKQYSWSQGVLGKFSSGYTDTPVSLGFDLNAQYALRLDSSGNDGSLPFGNDSKKTTPSYGRAGATLKLRYNQTDAWIGDQQPNYPIMGSETSRQLPSVAQGAVVQNRDLEGLTLTGGRFWSQVTRESSEHAELYLMNQSKGSASDDGLDFFGVDYDVSQNFRLSHWQSVLHDIYKQRYVGGQTRTHFGEGKVLGFDVRLNDFRADGDRRVGDIDNRNYGVGLSLTQGNHLIGATYQRMLGQTGYPLLSGNTDVTALVGWSSLGFIRPNEHSWSIRHVYNMAGIGLPGGRFFTRFSKGTQIDRGAGLARDKETETDFIADYVFQTGALKNLAIQLRYIPIRQKYGSDADTIRFNVNYSWHVF
ncbi:OprD family [Pseudomonas sp. S37]|uniref:OprD family outer membrane porin n=1 Tax=unclassified Pseudomonas TaxID=196821 RepID=UPI001912D45E|nr:MULTISPECIES: OprD family outer membrane porin [unclassified Pseudomonas]MBK4987631.1 OprD family [Pseudomonas sp. S36]MBK4991922.1 OprD family [Pseudomonas sp. S37]